VGAVITVAGFGLGFGLASLATPVLLADRYATTAYATIAGRLAPRHRRRSRRNPACRHAPTARRLPLLLAAVTTACLPAAAGMPFVGRRSDWDEHEDKPG
jgi:hypothetical protein